LKKEHILQRRAIKADGKEMSFIKRKLLMWVTFENWFGLFIWLELTSTNNTREQASTAGDVSDVSTLMFCTSTDVAVRRPISHAAQVPQADTVHRTCRHFAASLLHVASPAKQGAATCLTNNRCFHRTPQYEITYG